LASDIAGSLSLKYPVRDAGKVLLIPALQDAEKVSADLAAADSGVAGSLARAELMSEKGQVVTEMLW
jgi:hypothetical protein